MTKPWHAWLWTVALFLLLGLTAGLANELTGAP